MTKDIIKFPVVKRSPEAPLSEREIIRDAILTAVNMVALGLARISQTKRCIGAENLG